MHVPALATLFTAVSRASLGVQGGRTKGTRHRWLYMQSEMQARERETPCATGCIILKEQYGKGRKFIIYSQLRINAFYSQLRINEL